MTLNQELTTIKQTIIEDKELIAEAINEKTSGNLTSGNTFEEYAEAIGNISGGTSGKYPFPNGAKFQNYTGTTLDLSPYEFSGITDMKNFFSICSGLTVLDLSEFKTDSATNMQWMFREIDNLTELDLSSFNTSSVSDMSSMFYQSDQLGRSNKLASLDVSSFNTSAVTNMSNMFYYCYKLTTLNLSNFNTSAVTNMSSMFNYCRVLTTLDLSNINTSAVTNMYNMFYGCSGLTNLELNDLGHNTDCKSLSINNSPNLSKESCLYIFNNAYDRATAGYPAFTITLHSTAKARLTEEDIAIATSKGFTIA